MKKFKEVINQRTLRNFDKVSQVTGFTDIELAPAKPQRDPKGSKERDMRKISKKDRWDD
jgi:hypothetical protein